VADVGCGAGWSSIALARAYPEARVDGFDVDEASVDLARAHAAAEGVDDRVAFHLRDLAEGDVPAGGYDLVCALECIHDMARPVAVLRAMRALAAPDGAVLVMDERANDELTVGDPVNLERPVRLIDRLGGHLVQGHVDGVGEIVEPAPDLHVRCNRELLRYVVVKGSITVDGVSLTVVDVLDDGFTVAIIPHTKDVTTLGLKGSGTRVNLEVDVTAKYIERLLEWKAV
jgi:SAM-dependent methyltransferase